MEIKTVEFEHPQMETGASCVQHAWARVPEPLNAEQKQQLKDKIKRLLKEKGAVLVAHYYVDADLQDLAEETGGCVSDSLEMARFGRDHEAKTLVVAGVRFMGETAKILSPDKTVLMPDLDVRTAFINSLREAGINSVFHYIPLHSAPAGQRLGRAHGDLNVTTDVADRLVRLPLWLGLEDHQEFVIQQIKSSLRAV